MRKWFIMASNSHPLLEAKNISVKYPGASQSIFSHINLTVHSGQHISLMGASGSGKSTFLRLVCGLQRPTEGTIYFEGKELIEPTREIGISFQNNSLFPWKTVKENILLPKKLAKEEVSAEDLEWVIHQMEIENIMNRYPLTLSGGQIQRVSLARSILQKPKLLLLDEPFSALDSTTSQNCQSLLEEALMKKSIALILVTHSEEQAFRFGEQIIEFNKDESGGITYVRKN